MRDRTHDARGVRNGHLVGVRLAFACPWRERRGAHIEQSRAIVQRRRNRLCGPGERTLLRVAQHALQFAHVLVAQERDDEKHHQDQQELRADAECNAEGLHSPRLAHVSSAIHR